MRPGPTPGAATSTTPARRILAAATLTALVLTLSASPAPLTPAGRTVPAVAATSASATLAADVAQRGMARASRSAPRLAPTRASVAVTFALAQRGKSYRWGSAGPRGYDCSGLVLASWARVGVRLPHSANAIARYGRAVTPSRLLPGDLLLYGRRGRYYHVAIYVGGDWMMEAANRRAGVRLTRVRRPNAVRRVG